MDVKVEAVNTMRYGGKSKIKVYTRNRVYSAERPGLLKKRGYPGRR
jgi:hypothetical protein